MANERSVDVACIFVGAGQVRDAHQIESWARDGTVGAQLPGDAADLRGTVGGSRLVALVDLEHAASEPKTTRQQQRHDRDRHVTATHGRLAGSPQKGEPDCRQPGKQERDPEKMKPQVGIWLFFSSMALRFLLLIYEKF